MATHLKPQGCTNLKLRQLGRMVTRHYDRYLAEAGLKNTQYALLSHVVRLGPIRPSDLARRMQMDASTLTRNLQPMAAQGWLTIGQGEDGR
ncbi:MAG: MarR family transcriptional regulator, partial [Betaproteobacteria bacterium]|nr:MarR family transcriptional regulator [Betaproteobacteria bacterium]